MWVTTDGESIAAAGWGKACHVCGVWEKTYAVVASCTRDGEPVDIVDTSGAPVHRDFAPGSPDVCVRCVSHHPFQCRVCGKKTTSKCNLASHMWVHTGGRPRPHRCNVCGKTFTQKGHLRDHLTVHGSERNFKCALCSKRFKTKQQLNAHMYVHTGDQPRPFECSTCGKAFASRCALTVHTRTHTGERPFGCNLCAKAFTSKANLASHVAHMH